MNFKLNFPAEHDDQRTIQLKPGERLFVLGANGSGKSSLMFHFAQQDLQNTRRITAHRQTWMNTDALDMTSATKLQTEQNIQNTDRDLQSRFRDHYAAQRASMTIYELIDAVNVRARRITDYVDEGDLAAADKASKDESPINVINELLKHSNIPIVIGIQENERIVACKGDVEYSAAELSDGERNALLIAGTILTAPPGTLLIIDEPERHLHRSIIAPLLSRLFQYRSDCGFIVSTHDHGLPLDVPDAQILLLRSCKFNGSRVSSWEGDMLPANMSIDDSLMRDLLGARRNILFVEGAERSLDKRIYSLIFPLVSIIPKGSCHEVERAVSGIQAGQEFHWLKAFGITDGDGYETEQLQKKKEGGVYALPYYSVEALLLHPEIIQRIARKTEDMSGEDASKLIEKALAAGISAVADQTERLSSNLAKKTIRKLIVEQIPNDDELLAGNPVTIQNNARLISDSRKQELDTSVQNRDWNAILSECPIRESSAMADISKILGFRKPELYEQAVLHLLDNDESALNFLRNLFDDLYDRLSA